MAQTIEKIEAAADRLRQRQAKERAAAFAQYHKLLSTGPKAADDAKLAGLMVELNRRIDDLAADAELFAGINELRAAMGKEDAAALQAKLAAVCEQQTQAIAEHKAAIEANRDKVQTSVATRREETQIKGRFAELQKTFVKQKADLRRQIDAAAELQAKLAELRAEAVRRFGAVAKDL